MGAFSVDRNIASAKSIPALAQLLQKLFLDLEDFLNQSPALQPSVGSDFQRDRVGDLQINEAEGNLTLSYVVGENSKVLVTIGPSTTNLNSNFKGYLPEGTSFVDALPLDGNWAFITQTTQLFLVFNHGGTIKSVELTP